MLRDLFPYVYSRVPMFANLTGQWSEPAPSSDVQLLLRDLSFANKLGAWLLQVRGLVQLTEAFQSYMKKMLELVEQESARDQL